MSTTTVATTAAMMTTTTMPLKKKTICKHSHFFLFIFFLFMPWFEYVIFKRKIFIWPHIISGTKQIFCLALDRCTTKRVKKKITTFRRLVMLRACDNNMDSSIYTQKPMWAPKSQSRSLSAKNKCTISNFYLIMSARSRSHDAQLPYVLNFCSDKTKVNRKKKK